MPLSLVSMGEKRIVTSFNGTEEMKRHLQDLGFIKGQEVQVMSENSGGMILLIKGVRIALNRGLAQRIMVS